MKRSLVNLSILMILVWGQGCGAKKDGPDKPPLWSKFISFVSADAPFNAADRATPEKVVAQAKTLNEFSFAMTRELRGQGAVTDNTNFVFSPFSLRTAFAMVYSGAEENGEVQKEIATVLRYEGAEETLHHELKSQILGIRDSFTPPGKKKDLEWSLTNQVFVDKSLELQSSYLDTLKANYNVGVAKVDFRSSAASLENSRRAINDFVSDKTKSLVKDLLGKGVLTTGTVLTLVNAIYMLADWETPFRKADTSSLPFTTASGDVISAKTMTQDGTFGYYGSDDDTLHALSKSYDGGTVAMLWVVPKTGVALRSLEDSFSAERFAQIVDGLQSTSVALELPKFSMEWTSDLVTSTLKEMGMKTPFDCAENRFPRILADLNGLPWASESLCIQDVVHKAKIVVDEKGTEAAAATASTMTATSAPRTSVSFKVNKPSLFFVYDVKSKSILFMGHLANPR